MSHIVYFNGEYMDLKQAKVAVMDRGFLLGDGVYEVMPVYNGHLFRLASHLKRLRHSLDRVKMNLPLLDEQIGDIIQQLLNKNSSKAAMQSVYIHITRGVVEKREHAFKQAMEPTVFIKIDPVTSRYTDKGLKAVTVEDIRWRCCDIKSINRLANVLMSQQAFEAGADEAIVLEDGFVIEGAASNVFICKGGSLMTAELSTHILSGITRELVVLLAKQYAIPFQQKAISYEELLAADEVWVTSSSFEIAPVVKVDNHVVGNGEIGLMQQKMLQYYRDYVKKINKG